MKRGTDSPLNRGIAKESSLPNGSSKKIVNIDGKNYDVLEINMRTIACDRLWSGRYITSLIQFQTESV